MRGSLLALALVLAGCGNSGPSAETIAAERAAVAADAATRAENRRTEGMIPAAAESQRPAAAQPRPATGSMQIVRQSTRQGRIDPECDVTIRFPDGPNRVITVPYGTCAELRLQLMPVSRLIEAGMLHDISPFNRDLIQQATGGMVLYSEVDQVVTAYVYDDDPIASAVVLVDGI